jgi:hypothetical protein
MGRMKRWGRILPLQLNANIYNNAQILEAITWTQLGIHAKRMIDSLCAHAQLELELTVILEIAVIILNVLGFYDPLRALIKGAIASGFIKPINERLVNFIDPPPGIDQASFDWGTAALTALDAWSLPGPGIFTWDRNTCSI